MNAKGTNNLQSKYDFNSAWAERIAHLIIIGLAVDIVAAFILGKSYLEITLNIGANLLIIAGVWGELLFSRRAKEAGDGIVAEANANAAKAQERTASLEKETAVAKLELARLSTPRVKLLTSEAVASIVEKLSPFAGTKFDIGHAPRGREQWDFLWQLEPVFARAGWIFVDWDGQKFSAFGKPNWTMQIRQYGYANVSNAAIELTPENRETLLPAAQALVEALDGVGIIARIEPHPISGVSNTADAIHFLVGNKE